MHRVELALRRRVPRVGLSATLGDMSLAADALRPGEAGQVRCIESAKGGQELAVQVRGYLESPSSGQASEDGEETPPSSRSRPTFTRSFAGTTTSSSPTPARAVELFAARLRDLCEAAGVPNEFLPHHGNLSRELREDAEAALKDPSRPATAVATTTLEMGIDIGSVHSVAQVGAPPSVAALRQRLGRSGRRGEPAILRIYVTEPTVDPRTSLPDQLRAGLVQSIAMLDLLLEGWCEPPDQDALHLSTLIQQVLSAIAQHGGVTRGGRLPCPVRTGQPVHRGHPGAVRGAAARPGRERRHRPGRRRHPAARPGRRAHRQPLQLLRGVHEPRRVPALHRAAGRSAPCQPTRPSTPARC